MTTTRFGIFAALWTAAALGILQLKDIRFDHAMCLPGRCGPPLGAILSMQCFWLLGIGTAVVAGLYLLPKLPLRRIGMTMALVAIIGMGIVIAKDYASWKPAAHLIGKPATTSVEYHIQRFFFPIVTMTDVPWLQVLFGGGILALCHPQRSRTEPAQPLPTPVNEPVG